MEKLREIQFDLKAKFYSLTSKTVSNQMKEYLLDEDPTRDHKLIPHDELPFIYTPLAKKFNYIYRDTSNACDDFEKDYFRCASRVGIDRAKVDCFREIGDFLECRYGKKQVQILFF